MYIFSLSGSSLCSTHVAEMNVGSMRGGHVYQAASLFTFPLACENKTKCNERALRRGQNKLTNWCLSGAYFVIKMESIFPADFHPTL